MSHHLDLLVAKRESSRGGPPNWMLVFVLLFSSSTCQLLGMVESAFASEHCDAIVQLFSEMDSSADVRENPLLPLMEQSTFSVARINRFDDNSKPAAMRALHQVHTCERRSSPTPRPIWPSDLALRSGPTPRLLPHRMNCFVLHLAFAATAGPSASSVDEPRAIWRNGWH